MLTFWFSPGASSMATHIALHEVGAEFDARFVSLPESPLERRESLEQLRALEAGMRIACVRVDHAPFGVDTQADLDRANPSADPQLASYARRFVDTLEGAGHWQRLPQLMKQGLRDNATTLIGQVRDNRPPFSRADAESIKMPTLFIGGERTKGLLPKVLHALAAHVPNAKTVMIPNATHPMFEQAPQKFSEVVLEFLAG